MIEVDWSGKEPKVRVITNRTKYFKDLTKIFGECRNCGTILNPASSAHLHYEKNNIVAITCIECAQNILKEKEPKLIPFVNIVVTK